MAGDVDYLPPDLISRILLCLPVSSLVRLKSVCKSWLSLIETPDFIYKHFHSDRVQQMNLFILSSWYLSSDMQQQVSLFTTDNKSELLLDFPIFHDPYQIIPVKLVASCHGIICLQHDRTVCLYNPATKHYTNLPPLPVMSYQVAIGFGFDPIANDYKLVAINEVNRKEVFHIYCLSSDSWRKFEGSGLGLMLGMSNINTPYRDRIFCWTRENSIQTFDFSDEVFGNIPLPCTISSYTVFILMENIACVGRVKNRDYVYEVWMLSDYQVKESWTKLYSANPYSEWKTGFSNNGDFLLFQAGSFLCLYDLVTREVMNLPAHANGDVEVVTYRESMLSIRRGNGATNVVTSTDSKTRMSVNQSMTGNSSWGNSDIHKAEVFHILLWLPVVSLQRFKSVCKSWHSLIKSSDFVTQHQFLHHHHHKLDNVNLILHSSNISWYPLFEDSAHHSPYTSCTCLLSADKLDFLDLPICDLWEYGGLYIMTSFNGIICLKPNDHGNFYLWNPATKQLREIIPDRLPNEGGMDIHIGFGFDVKTNNYKLVRFYQEYESGAAQAYCLSTDSWRTIHDKILSTFRNIVSGLDAPYKNGIYCWLAETGFSCAILSFDFSNEVFGTIPLPDDISKSSLSVSLDGISMPSFSLYLTVLRDNLVCISLGEDCYPPAENSHCAIWMMNEYGSKESWVKLYMVGPFSNEWSYKMCYTKKNEDYIMLLKDGQLYEYDLAKQEIERLPCQIQGPKNYQVVAYKESLVSVKGGTANGSLDRSEKEKF